MPAPSRRFSFVTIVGLTVIAAWCIRGSIRDSANPYAYYHGSPEGFEFPLREVMEWASVVAVEALGAAWLLWRAQGPRATSLLLALLFGLGMVCCAPFVMHSPPYFGMHIGFLALAAGWLALAAVVGWVARSASNAWIRAHPERDREPPPARLVTRDRGHHE